MKKLLDIAKQNNAEIEIYKIISNSTTVDVRNKEVESIDAVQEGGLSIKVIKDHKLGFAYTTDFEDEALELSFQKALDSSKYTIEDPNYSIPTSEKYEPLATFDREILDLSIEKKIDYAKQMESAAYSADNRVKKTEKISFSTSETKITILNSNGIDITYHANHCGGICEVIAEAGSEQESGFGMSFVTRLWDFNSNNVGIESAQRASELLLSKPISPKIMPLILDPYVGAQLLGAISNLFSSDAVQKNKSLFAHKIGQTVASSCINIIDDGRLKNGVSSSPVDDEGVPTKKTTLIEKGKLMNYLYNTYTAKKEGKPSTGSGRRASYKSLPEVSPSNLFFEPGINSKDNLISKVKSGLYVKRVMGMHTVNPISGDFSIGAAGIMVENGNIAYPVRGITISGNLIDFLQAIDEVGSDLRFFPMSANLGSPTLLVSNIAVSG
ncbi:TldD/PmbA family protein [Candidatus Saganbacteria bacterium]|nr:TldD/PmbA family protein [Candidatus Saganbacteria bacterium]